MSSTSRIESTQERPFTQRATRRDSAASSETSEKINPRTTTKDFEKVTKADGDADSWHRTFDQVDRASKPPAVPKIQRRRYGSSDSDENSFWNNGMATK